MKKNLNFVLLATVLVAGAIATMNLTGHSAVAMTMMPGNQTGGKMMPSNMTNSTMKGNMTSGMMKGNNTTTPPMVPRK